MEFLPSVTSKRICRLSLRWTLPSFTRPPRRIRVPAAMCFSATSVGELKKTIESLSAPSTSATATASTERAEPMRTSRLCFRVIVTFPSAFEAQPFNQLVDLTQLLRLAGHSAAGLADRSQGLVALTQYHIGAHQAQPSLEIGTVAVQTLGQLRYHVVHHNEPLLGGHLRCRCHILGGRAAARHSRDLLAYEISPWRIGRCRRQHGAPDLRSRGRPAVLLGRDAKEIPRLDVARVKLGRALECLLGFRRD